MPDSHPRVKRTYSARQNDWRVWIESGSRRMCFTDADFRQLLIDGVDLLSEASDGQRQQT